MKKTFYIFLAIVASSALLMLPAKTYAASPCGSGTVIGGEKQDSQTKVWTCTYNTSQDGQGKSGDFFLTEYRNDDGTQVTNPDGTPKVVFTNKDTGQTINQSGQTTPPPNQDTCSLWAFSFNDCIWKPLLSWMGSLFLSLGALILRVAGLIFDILIQHVIIGFKTTLDYFHITEAIRTGWTVFRDFANILIIGMFVFIAISIILGNHEYGQKKLIANILIIAVLLNFSLLFTSLVIDFSNFTAYQLYNAMTGGNKNYDIAQSFLNPMSIDDVFKSTYPITRAAASTNGAIAGFVFGLVGGIMLAAVAAVLLYGCFLIAARGILFIFLLLTSSLAFATYLIPGMASGKYGFNNWWKSLLNNAIFAPLLMLFLAISLGIINAAEHIAGNGGRDAITGIMTASTASQADNVWGIILVYLLGIGLLFISFRLSSSFAGSISGFNLASLATLAPIGAASRLGGLIGRSTVGKLGQGRFEKIRDRIQTEKRAPTTSELAQMRFGRYLGGRSFDTFTAANKNLPKGFTSIIGKETGKGGYDATKKRQAETAASIGKGLGIEKGVVKKATDETTKKIQEEQAGTIHAAEQNVTAARTKGENDERAKLQSSIDNLSKTLGQKNIEADAKRRQNDVEYRKEVDQISKAAGTERENLAKQFAASKAAREEELQKIMAARDKATADLAVLNKQVTDAGTHAAKDAQDELNELNANIAATAKAQVEAATDAGIAKRVAIRRAGTGFGAWYAVTGKDREKDPVVKRIGHAFHHKEQHEKLKDLAHVINENAGHGDDHGGGHGEEKKGDHGGGNHAGGGTGGHGPAH